MNMGIDQTMRELMAKVESDLPGHSERLIEVCRGLAVTQQMLRGVSEAPEGQVKDTFQRGLRVVLLSFYSLGATPLIDRAKDAKEEAERTFDIVDEIYERFVAILAAELGPK